MPRTGLIAAPDAFFEVIKHGFREYRQRGMFVQGEGSCFLVYHLREGGNTYCGLIAALPSALYRNGLIKRHEGTLAASEQQQLQLLVLRQALVKPVLLTYPAVPQIDLLLQDVVREQAPLLELTDGPGISHTLYAVKPDVST